MGQTVIIDKFKRYLLRNEPDLRCLAPERANQHQCLTNMIDAGLCYGFSVTYAVMNYLGYGQWWQNVLEFIAQWDETENGLNQVFSMPGVNNAYTREQLFEKACSYVLFNHKAYPIFYEMPRAKTDLFSYLQQHTVQPNSYQHLQVLHGGQVLSVTNQRSFAGHFEPLELNVLLDSSKDLFREHLVLLNSVNHSIHVNYDGAKWHVYDPNYGHDNAFDMKTFDGASEVGTEINSILGQQLAIIAFSLDSKPISCPFYENLWDNSCPSLQRGNTGSVENGQPANNNLLKHGAVTLIYRYDIHRFGQLLFQAQQGSIEAVQVLVRALQQPLAKSTNLLHVMAYQGDYLIELFKLAKQNTHVKEGLKYALTVDYYNLTTPVHIMFANSYNQISEIINDCLETNSANDEILQTIAAQLTKRNSLSGTSCLYMFLNVFYLELVEKEQARSLMASLTRLMINRNNLAHHIFESLAHQDHDGNSGFHMLIHSFPEYAAQWLDMEFEHDSAINAICQCLSVTNHQNLTPLHVLLAHPQDKQSAKDCVTSLTNLTNKYPKVAVLLIDSLDNKNSKNVSVLEALLKHAFFTGFFSQATVKYRSAQVLNKLIRPDNHHDSLCRSFTRLARRGELVQLLKLARSDVENKTLLWQLLLTEDQKESSGMVLTRILRRVPPAAVRNLFRFLLKGRYSAEQSIALMHKKDQQGYYVIDHFCHYGGVDAATSLMYFADCNKTLQQTMSICWPLEADNNVFEPLIALSVYHPERLMELLAQTEHDRYLQKRFAQAMATEYQYGLVYQLAKRRPDMLQKVIEQYGSNHVLSAKLRQRLTYCAVDQQGRYLNVLDIVPQTWQSAIKSGLDNHDICVAKAKVLGKRYFGVTGLNDQWFQPCQKAPREGTATPNQSRTRKY